MKSWKPQNCSLIATKILQNGNILLGLECGSSNALLVWTVFKTNLRAEWFPIPVSPLSNMARYMCILGQLQLIPIKSRLANYLVYVPRENFQPWTRTPHVYLISAMLSTGTVQTQGVDVKTPLPKFYRAHSAECTTLVQSDFSEETIFTT